MVQINFALREVNCKIVFYGPGLSGKTTNLEIVHKKAPEANKGELTSIATEGDRTLFFDFMPLVADAIEGYQTRFQLYTVTGQSMYKATRRLVLRRVDGVVFVADSQISRLDENVDSYLNLWDNLRSQGDDLSRLGMVLQMNKRDLGEVFSVADMTELLNHTGSPVIEACALSGAGVFETLKTVCKQVIAKSTEV